MKNEYLKNLKKIEFVITNACTGRCKHCSEGNHSLKGESIDATKSVEELTESYLKTYDANYKTLRGDGASPRSGDGTPNPKEDKFLDDYFAKKAVEGRFPENK